MPGAAAGDLPFFRRSISQLLSWALIAVVPQMIAPIVSFSIYRWDIFVRMSTIIGLAGGGGNRPRNEGRRGPCGS